jgi:hypothetical protein
MTTKRARSRRLVPSEHLAQTGASGDVTFWYARRGDLTADTSRRIHHSPRHRWWCGRVEWDAILRGGANGSHWITARTRLALHDAILRAGWPSPWTEL